MQWGYRHRVLGLAVAGNFSQFGARLALSPLLPFILVEFSLTKATAGLLLTGMWMLFALTQYPSGILADRFGERRVILASMTATALASLLLAFVRGIVSFGVVVLLVGVGSGLYFSVGTSLLTRLFEERGGALGLHSTGAPLSGLAIPVIVSAVATRVGWQWGFLVPAGIAGLTALLFLLLVRPTPPARPELTVRKQFQPSRLRHLLRRRQVATSTALAIIGMFVFQAFVSFFPTFLQEHHGLAPEPASLLFGATFGLTALSLPIQGRLSDRLSYEAVLAGAFVTTAVGFGLVLVLGNLVGLAVGLVVLAAGFGWGGVLQSRIMAGFPAEDRGTGFGLVRTVFVLLGASGSAVTGFLAQLGGWFLAYGLVAGLLGATGLVLVATQLAGSARNRTRSG